MMIIIVNVLVNNDELTTGTEARHSDYLRSSSDGIRFSEQRFHVNNINNNNCNVLQVSVNRCI